MVTVRWLLPPQAWWPAGIALLAFLYALLVAFLALRWPKPAKQRCGDRLARMMFLIAIAWIPLFAFLGVPAALICFLPPGTGQFAMVAWIASSFALLVLVCAWARYLWHPHNFSDLRNRYARALGIRPEDVPVDELPQGARISPDA
jgi:ABC-type amino acid transport system permease subunit